MSSSSSFSYKVFSKDDFNGFWALFADNLANMVIIATICLYVFRFPKTIVMGRILPSGRRRWRRRVVR